MTRMNRKSFLSMDLTKLKQAQPKFAANKGRERTTAELVKSMRLATKVIRKQRLYKPSAAEQAENRRFGWGSDYYRGYRKAMRVVR